MQANPYTFTYTLPQNYRTLHIMPKYAVSCQNWSSRVGEGGEDDLSLSFSNSPTTLRWVGSHERVPCSRNSLYRASVLVSPLLKPRTTSSTRARFQLKGRSFLHFGRVEMLKYKRVL
jgi:hypothetical protein